MRRVGGARVEGGGEGLCAICRGWGTCLAGGGGDQGDHIRAERGLLGLSSTWRETGQAVLTTEYTDHHTHDTQRQEREMVLVSINTSCRFSV